MKTYEIGWAQVIDGKWHEAIELEKEAMAYFEAKGWHAGRRLQPLDDSKTNHMIWIFEFDSQADYEKWYEPIHADAGVKEFITRMESVYVREGWSFFAYKEVL